MSDLEAMKAIGLKSNLDIQILTGDSLKILPTLEPGYVQSCITSPPYWGLRDYDHPSQIGAEPSPEQYVENLVAIFREARPGLAAQTARLGVPITNGRSEKLWTGFRHSH